jgi:hypothetical protein
MDHAETIAKLRDIHLPPAQDFTTNIILSILGCISAIILYKIIIYYSFSSYPIRSAALRALKNSRLLNSSERLAAQSRILREVAHSIDHKLSFQKDDAWLEQLDRIFATNFFTKREGKIYGEILYQKATHLPVDILDKELVNLLSAFKK